MDPSIPNSSSSTLGALNSPFGSVRGPQSASLGFGQGPLTASNLLGTFFPSTGAPSPSKISSLATPLFHDRPDISAIIGAIGERQTRPFYAIGGEGFEHLDQNVTTIGIPIYAREEDRPNYESPLFSVFTNGNLIIGSIQQFNNLLREAANNLKIIVNNARASGVWKQFTGVRKSKDAFNLKDISNVGNNIACLGKGVDYHMSGASLKVTFVDMGKKTVFDYWNAWPGESLSFSLLQNNGNGLGAEQENVFCISPRIGRNLMIFHPMRTATKAFRNGSQNKYIRKSSKYPNQHGNDIWTSVHACTIEDASPFSSPYGPKEFAALSPDSHVKLISSTNPARQGIGFVTKQIVRLENETIVIDGKIRPIENATHEVHMFCTGRVYPYATCVRHELEGRNPEIQSCSLLNATRLYDSTSTDSSRGYKSQLAFFRH